MRQPQKIQLYRTFNMIILYHMRSIMPIISILSFIQLTMLFNQDINFRRELTMPFNQDIDSYMKFAMSFNYEYLSKTMDIDWLPCYTTRHMRMNIDQAIQENTIQGTLQSTLIGHKNLESTGMFLSRPLIN